MIGTDSTELGQPRRGIMDDVPAPGTGLEGKGIEGAEGTHGVSSRLDAHSFFPQRGHRIGLPSVFLGNHSARQCGHRRAWIVFMGSHYNYDNMMSRKFVGGTFRL